LAALDITCFNLILTSTLARSLWGMKFEISYICYQYLGCSSVTYWRNNLGIKKEKRKKEKQERKKEKKNDKKNIDRFELFTT